MAAAGLGGAAVLVTGGAGFIGRHLVERILADRPGRVLVTARTPLAGAREDVEWIHSDLRDLSPETWRAMGVGRFDAVFHLAGHVRRAPGPEAEGPVFESNLEGTRRLLESLPETGRVVFASTTDVYGDHGGAAVVTEGTCCDPQTLYAASKLFCEHLVAAACRRRGWAFSLLRYGNAYGPGDGGFGKLVPVLARQVVRGVAPILTGDPASERDLIYVADVAEATVRAAGTEIRELGPVNVVSGRSHRIDAVAELLARLAGVAYSAPPSRPDGSGAVRLRFDNRLMRETLGDWPLVGLEAGLRLELAALGG